MKKYRLLKDMENPDHTIKAGSIFEMKSISSSRFPDFWFEEIKEGRVLTVTDVGLPNEDCGICDMPIGGEVGHHERCHPQPQKEECKHDTLHGIKVCGCKPQPKQLPSPYARIHQEVNRLVDECGFNLETARYYGLVNFLDLNSDLFTK